MDSASKVVQCIPLLRAVVFQTPFVELVCITSHPFLELVEVACSGKKRHSTDSDTFSDVGLPLVQVGIEPAFDGWVFFSVLAAVEFEESGLNDQGVRGALKKFE